ncbi:MAG: glutathione S-transferase family protein [Steroidobacterales bacterium]
MYELYYSPGTASFAVHWMLIEMKLPHKLKLVDFDAKEQKSPGYLRLNPDGVVPTLVIDGVPRSESAALLLTLADRHPAAGLAPATGADERAAYYQWTFYCANSLQPAFRQWFYPDEAAGGEQAVKALARARIERCWDRFEALLADGRTHMLGERLSALDFLATMLMRWSRNMPRPSTAWPVLARYVQRMRAMDSFRTTYAREGLTDWANA